MSAFKATSSGSGLVFDWSTATETGNAGFNIYADSESCLVQFNEELILSQAVDSGQQLNYSYTADGVSGDLFYIEDVGVFGDRRKHGPFTLGETYGAQLEDLIGHGHIIEDQPAVGRDGLQFDAIVFRQRGEMLVGNDLQGLRVEIEQAMTGLRTLIRQGAALAELEAMVDA